jgi:hypothetical protein
VDAVANIWPSGHTVKMYLVRTDPEISGKAEFKNHVIAQLIMPTDGFVQTVLFLSNALEGLIESKAIDKEFVESMRVALSNAARR